MDKQLMPSWVDTEDKILFKQKSSKLRPKYRVKCSSCGADRGYKFWQNCKTHPNCLTCSRQLDKSRTQLFWQKYHKVNHPWNKGKRNVFSPITRAKIGQASSNRNYSDVQKETIKLKIKLTFAQKYGFSSIEDHEVANKIKRNLRSRLNKAIKGNFKSGSAVEELSCSIKEFRIYLETLWTTGMSWANYGGENGWQIDHIVPLNKFDLLDLVQLKEACYYKNLQPLWPEDNLNKRTTDGTF